MKRIWVIYACGALLASVLALAAFGQTPSKEPAKKAGKTELIDINSAKKDQLMTLKGIGDAYSDAIIKNRPYKRKDELVAKKVIPQATYDGIKDQIVARQSAQKKK